MDNLRQEFNKLKVLIEKQFKREYDLIALADKRLELLKEVQNKLSFCLFCDIEYLPGNDIDRLKQHTADCELKKVLDAATDAR